MGYGHQRAAYPLTNLAYERVITANTDQIVSKKERGLWIRLQSSYEWISKIRSLPLIGELLWKIYDHFQSISPYYPFRDLSRPNMGSIYMHRLINKGFISDIIHYIKKQNIPLVSTFFAPALAAAHDGLKNVYCVITDTDINRVWVPEFPKQEKLHYFTPTKHSTKRLVEYGVPRENIFFTGFPLPKENIGKNLDIAKKDINYRLHNLDPKRVYISRYKETIKKQLGKFYKNKKDHPLTITFAVGGAGAQKEIGADIIKSLKNKILDHKIRINLIAGTHLDVNKYYHKTITNLGLEKEIDKYINIICAADKENLFKVFNKTLHTTDILWTKPSELSFYTALGIPIIIAPPLGAHEILNQKWLTTMGAGIPQENPKYTNEWLFEWLNNGILAEYAWNGFTEAPRFGTYNIEDIIFSKNKKKVKLKY